MKVIKDKIEQNTAISEDTQLLGMIVGLTTVSKNVIFQIHGMIIGDLILNEGATVYINGIVDGNIANNGGHLEIFGIVNGKINTDIGETIIGPKAIVSM